MLTPTGQTLGANVPTTVTGTVVEPDDDPAAEPAYTAVTPDPHPAAAMLLAGAAALAAAVTTARRGTARYAVTRAAGPSRRR